MRILYTMLMVFSTLSIHSQSTYIEGYIYESGNRGYLNNVSVTAENMTTNKILGKTRSDAEGYFKIDVPMHSKIRLYCSKDMFDIKRLETEVGSGKTFIKMEMGRAPGYTFEVTLAEKKSRPDEVVDAITGARIEVYNNTTRQSVMDLKDHDNPEFQLNLKKGNHYTVLIRKSGFLSKRMEAFIDVEGCLMCFEGLGTVDPGVSDNLTEDNAFGVMLANVELERIFEGKKMEIQNLYYALGKWNLNGAARTELNKVITLMGDNPNLSLELGSHTDSRGSKSSNLELSNKRAKSAVNYLIQKGGIAKNRLVYRGYGEEVLINECKDYVECSEVEHAKNRRTELKIIGITDVSEVKSLEQMKKEEFMEAQILELMDQEQIIAKDEEDLKRILEAKQEKEPEARKEMLKKKKEKSELDAYREEVEQEKVPETSIVEEVAPEDPIEKEVEEIKEFGEVVEEEIKEENPVEEEEEIEEVVEEDDFMVSDGIKVVVFQSETPLGADHFVFRRHSNLEVLASEVGMSYYMVGGFDNELEAFNFLRAFIRPDKKYKGSFVAKFTKGVMAVVNE